MIRAALLLLRGIPLKDWLYFTAMVVIATLVGMAVHHERGVGAAKVEAVRQAEHAQLAAIAASQVAADQAKHDRQVADQKEVSRETDRLNAASTVAAHDAADAAARLLDRFAAAGRSPAAAASATSGPGPAASAPADVRDLVLARTLDAARLAAAFADSAHIAGQACERDYDALTR